MNNQAILELTFESDIGTVTIREFLYQLVNILWADGESFSGKRPFGNSSWEYDILVPLIKHKIITGMLDEDGYIESVDYDRGKQIIKNVIKEIFYP